MSNHTYRTTIRHRFVINDEGERESCEPEVEFKFTYTPNKPVKINQIIVLTFDGLDGVSSWTGFVEDAIRQSALDWADTDEGENILLEKAQADLAHDQHDHIEV